MRKTKIVCTLGPATDSEEILKELMLEGMNVARINFSHGNYQDQEDRINMFKKVRNELGLPVPLLLDTRGPEIRIGKFENNEIYLDNGQEFTLTNGDDIGNKNQVSITYKSLCDEIDIGIETNPDHKKKGLGIIVANEMIQYTLQQGKKPVWACHCKNTASEKMAEKLGFVKIGECFVLKAAN